MPKLHLLLNPLPYYFSVFPASPSSVVIAFNCRIFGRFSDQRERCRQKRMMKIYLKSLKNSAKRTPLPLMISCAFFIVTQSANATVMAYSDSLEPGTTNSELGHRYTHLFSSVFKQEQPSLEMMAWTLGLYLSKEDSKLNTHPGTASLALCLPIGISKPSVTPEHSSHLSQGLFAPETWSDRDLISLINHEWSMVHLPLTDLIPEEGQPASIDTRGTIDEGQPFQLAPLVTPTSTLLFGCCACLFAKWRRRSLEIIISPGPSRSSSNVILNFEEAQRRFHNLKGAETI